MTDEPLCQEHYSDLKKRSGMFRFLFLLIVCYTLCGNAHLEAREVRVGVYDNPPKVEMGPDDTPRGLFIDIIEHVAGREGWELRYVHGTWKQCLQRLDSGDIDIMPDVAYSEERCKRYSFHKIPVQTSWLQVFSSANVSINGISDINGKTLAVLKGSVQERICRDLREGFRLKFSIILCPDYKETIKQVESGRADAILAGRFYGFNRGSYGSLKPTPVILRPSSLFFAVSRGRNGDLLPAIDKHLAGLVNDPHSAYYAAIERWLGKAPKKFIPGYVLWGVVSISAVLLFFFVLSVVLKFQVGKRTMELENKNNALEDAYSKLETAKDDAVMKERFFAFGQLASGTVHDFNNILQPILWHVDLMLKKKDHDVNFSELMKKLKIIRKAVRHGTEIVERMRQFYSSTGYSEVRSPVDVNAVVRDVIEIGAHHLRSGYGHVDVVFQDGEDCEISGRRSSLYEMLLNLVINAVDAMPDGGEIGISTSRMNGTVILEVRDSGTGMTEEVRKKCLEPFFTSKGNRGTGIGLMMVNNIVQDHSGKLEIESAPGKGTTFRISLPVSPEEEDNRRGQSLVSAG